MVWMGTCRVPLGQAAIIYRARQSMLANTMRILSFPFAVNDRLAIPQRMASLWPCFFERRQAPPVPKMLGDLSG